MPAPPPPTTFFRANGALPVVVTELSFLTLYAVTVLFCPRRVTAARIVSVVVLFGLTYLLLEAFSSWCSNLHWRGFVSACLPVQLLNASDIILIEPVDISSGNSLQRANQAIALLMNQRRIGTKWQVKGVSSEKTTSRPTFLLKRFACAFVAYICLDAMLVWSPQVSPTLIAAEKQTLTGLTSLSTTDVVFRIGSSLGYWLNGFLLILVVADTIAFILVAIGLSSPADRPPLFGNIAKAYTIRGFWSDVWHQCLRRCLTSHSDAYFDCVLRIPRGTLLSRYGRILTCFVLSGAVHHVCVQGMGVPATQARAFVFFPLQALGIILEDAVQAAVGNGNGGFFGRKWVRRAAGYVWVILFFAWSSPSWFDPQLRVGTDPKLLLPVSLVSSLVA